MRTNKKTLILIIFLILLLIVLLFLKTIAPKKIGETPVVSPTITSLPVNNTPTPFQTISPTLPFQVEKIIKDLPVITPNYTIEYLPKPNKIAVIILNNPYSDFKKEVEEWFLLFEIDPSDPIIFWGSVRGVSPE